MRITLSIIVLIFLSVSAKAQEKIDELEGVVFNFSLTKIKDDSKFNYYSATVNAVNTNAHDIFYRVPGNQAKPIFATIIEDESDTVFNLEGLPVNLFMDNMPLYFMEANSVTTSVKEFQIKKGSDHSFKLSFNLPLEKLLDLR